MSALIFTCPTTKQVIDSGIETERPSLAQVQQVALRIRCPHCGGVHTLQVREGRLEDAA